MRSDTEHNAQQSTVDNPTATKRSPLKKTPSSLQQLRQAIAEELEEGHTGAEVGHLRNMHVCDLCPTPHVSSDRRPKQLQEFGAFALTKARRPCAANMTVPVTRSALILWL